MVKQCNLKCPYNCSFNFCFTDSFSKTFSVLTSPNQLHSYGNKTIRIKGEKRCVKKSPDLNCLKAAAWRRRAMLCYGHPRQCACNVCICCALQRALGFCSFPIISPMRIEKSTSPEEALLNTQPQPTDFAAFVAACLSVHLCKCVLAR